MSATPPPTGKTVTLSDLHTVLVPDSPGREDPMLLPQALRDRSTGDALLSQIPARASLAIGAALVQLVVIRATGSHAGIAPLALATLGYLAAILLVRALVRARRGASPTVVTGALGLDLAFIYTFVAVSTTPAHYERAMLGAMVVIHAANFYFGRRQAFRVITMGLAGYVALLAIARMRGLGMELVDEVWTLAIGFAGTTLMAVQAGHMRRRLRTILTLFERAEQGDFSQTYDEAADQRYDAITRVGRAYNRVRIQLASMVLTDPLTGCLNRRGFEQALAREIARASRAGSELALLVLDLDHFKQVNDTYGHPAGDEVLRTAGRLLQDTARVGDIVSRVGGEEFAILLPATGAEGALRFATRLCDLVRAHQFLLAANAPSIRVTTSVGVASVAPRNSRDSVGEGAVLARRADIALYAAKRAGRDQAHEWAPQLEILPRASGPLAVDDGLPMGLA